MMNNLFNAIKSEYQHYLMDLKNSALRKNILIFPSSEGLRLSQSLFDNLKIGGFCTLLVNSKRGWDFNNHHYQLTRNAAKNGAKIERAFLLPHRHSINNKDLIEHYKLDKEAGINVKIVYIGGLLSNMKIPLIEILEFGLWDNSVGCIGSVKNNIDISDKEWRVTSRPEDLELLLNIKTILQDEKLNLKFDNDNMSIIDSDLEEPMLTTAPLAYELANVLCKGDHVSKEDCSWYHKSWQYLRILNSVSTPTWHREFYKKAFNDFFEIPRKINILISGTADYSMLAHVIDAKPSNNNLDITVLDLCETPLLLCKWYSKFVGQKVKTVSFDLLKYENDKKYDLITTDAFLTRFTPQERNLILAKWNDLLCIGGKIVTTIRIENGMKDSILVTSQEQAKQFAKKAKLSAKRWMGFIDLSTQEIEELAFNYAIKMTSYSLNSKEDIINLFKNFGFDFIELQIASVPGEIASTLYAEIIVTKTKNLI